MSLSKTSPAEKCAMLFRVTAVLLCCWERVDGLSVEGGHARLDRRELLQGAGAGVAFLTGTPAVQALESGNKKLDLGKIGIGAWAWGDSLFWGYDPKNDFELKECFDFLATSPATGFIDTAEVYGFGRSEELINSFSKEVTDFKIPIATKFAALPWRTSAADVVKACEASLTRLDRPYIDLYQIHFPNGWANEKYWDGLADCVDKGLVKAVGVSNYGVDAIKACQASLASRGIPLTSNQIQYSLLYRYPEENGLLETCKDLNIDVLAYSPLGLGLCTNTYTRENGKLPKGPREALTKTYLADDRFLALQNSLDTIASRHNAVPAAVALNWVRAKGAIPIAGARNLKQCKQNLASVDWDLSKTELTELDDIAGKLPWLGIKPPFAEKDVFTGLKMFDS